MPDILDLITELMVPGESYTLQRRVNAINNAGDDLGDPVERWIDVQPLYGSMDNPSTDPETRRGHEEISPSYKGYFHSNFDIPTNKFGEYRIKHILPVSVNSKETFTRYYGIKGFDRNLNLDDSTVYVGMVLEHSLKWDGD